MIEVVASIIMALCSDSEYNSCMDYFANCVVESNGSITGDSIEKCIKEFKDDESFRIRSSQINKVSR